MSDEEKHKAAYVNSVTVIINRDFSLEIIIVFNSIEMVVKSNVWDCK